jgi:hypothetical protein
MVSDFRYPRHIILRDLLTQKCSQKRVTDFGYWIVDSENIKLDLMSPMGSAALKMVSKTTLKTWIYSSFFINGPNKSLRMMCTHCPGSYFDADSRKACAKFSHV